MTEDVIRLIQELGFPVAVSIGCMGLLGWIVRYILKDKVEDTLTRFDARHDHLLKSIGEIKIDKKSVAFKLFSGNFYPPKVRYTVDIIKCIPHS